jgi:hypothetical protein
MHSFLRFPKSCLLSFSQSYLDQKWIRPRFLPDCGCTTLLARRRPTLCRDFLMCHRIARQISQITSIRRSRCTELLSKIVSLWLGSFELLPATEFSFSINSFLMLRGARRSRHGRGSRTKFQRHDSSKSDEISCGPVNRVHVFLIHFANHTVSGDVESYQHVASLEKLQREFCSEV